MPERSIFPDKLGGSGWAFGDIPDKFGGGKRGKSVQGFKLHICAHPESIQGLFDALHATLILYQLPHKFAPFQIFSQQQVGHAAFQLIGSDAGDSAAGKACVVYPSNPTDLGLIVPVLDDVIRRSPGIRPFPGGVKGDMALGKTGFIYCRYGAFQGDLARQYLVYDPIAGNTCHDPRFIKPLPDFFKYAPGAILAVRRS